MSWRDVARRDLTSAWRSRTIPAVGLTILFFSAGVIALQLYLDGRPPPPSTTDAVRGLSAILMLFVPIVGLWGAYGTIVTERVTGSVRFLLGLPNSRLGVYAGKYASRGAVVTGSIAFSMLLTAVIVGAGYHEGSFGTIAALGGLTVLYGLVFVGMGLAISTLFSTESRASTGVILTFLVLRIGWPALQYAGLEFTNTTPRIDGYPDWYFVLGRVNPMNAYVKLTTFVADLEPGIALITAPAGPETFVTSGTFALLVLFAWGTAVPVLGYLRFRSMDLL